MYSGCILTANLGKDVARRALILAWIAMVGFATIDTSNAAPVDDQLRTADSTSDEEQTLPEVGPAEATTADDSELEADAEGRTRTVHGVEAPIVSTSSEPQQPPTLPETENKTIVAARDPTSYRVIDPIEVFDECFVPDICIDRYLWALYQRAPKEDSIS